MNQQYIAYIIPWFGENENPVNKKIQKLFEAKGIECKICNIHWKHRVMSDYVAEFLEFYHANPSGNRKVILFGFSFGAFTGMLVSTKIRIHSKILCSVSPYWKEDLSVIPNWWKKFCWIHRIADFKQFSCKDVIQKSTWETYILVGEKEHNTCIKRNMDIAKSIGTQCKIIPNTPHDIANPNYLWEIESIIKSFPNF